MRYGRAGILLFATGLTSVVVPARAEANGLPEHAPAAPPVGRPLGQPLARPLGQPLARPLGQPLARPLGQPLAPVVAAARPAVAAPVETAAPAPPVDAPVLVRPVEHLETLVASHGRDVQLRSAEVAQLRPSFDAAHTKVTAVRAALAQAKVDLAKAEESGPGLFANVFTLGGASRRHYERTGALRAKLGAAEKEADKAEQSFRSVKGRFDKAEASWKEAKDAHTAAEAELGGARRAATAEAKTLAHTDSASKANQYLLHLLANGGGTESYRRAAQRARAASFVVDKPRDGGALTEDAVAMNPEKGIYAISDGVTNAVDSGPLARLLVRRFTTQPPRSPEEMTTTWLRGVQADWSKETAGLKGRNLWFNQGALGNATFVGAEVVEGAAGPALRVTGIGDSMIFVLRGGKVMRRFPLESSKEFSNLVETLPSRGKADFPVRQVTWDVSPDDEVFMTTDALGKWVFTQLEHGHDPFPALRSVKTQEGWSALVSSAREQRDALPMDVDDTALVRFVIPKKP
jgi:phage shock protein A